MKKYFSLLIFGLFLTGCANGQIENAENTVPINTRSQKYQEIETALKSETVDNSTDFSKIIPKEIARLQKNGEVFWQDQNHTIPSRTPMYHLQPKTELKKEGLIVGLQAYKDNFPPEFKIEDACDTYGWCSITEPVFEKDVVNNIKQLAGFYGFGKDIYMIGSNSGSLNGEGRNGDYNYSIYKNDKEIFSHKMYFGAESVIEDASIVLNSPAFTFYNLKEWKNENTPVVTRNIWHNNETINEKYAMEGSSHLFSYKDKLGFVGEKDGKTFLIFNGQKISKDFDEIRTNNCCAVTAYPIDVDENGILFFLAKRGEKYFFGEIRLNGATSLQRVKDDNRQ